MNNVLLKCKVNFAVSAALLKYGKTAANSIFNNLVDGRFRLTLNNLSTI